MPYADPARQREAQARWYREKYRRDREFQAAEAERKARWIQTDEGRASNAAASKRHRAVSKGQPAVSKSRRAVAKGQRAIGKARRAGKKQTALKRWLRVV